MLQQHLHAFLVPVACRIVESRGTVLRFAGGGEEGEGEDARAPGSPGQKLSGVAGGVEEGGRGAGGVRSGMHLAAGGAV